MQGSAAESLRLLTPRGPVPLGFAEAPGRIYLVARARSAQWPVDLLRSGRAELALPGSTAVGTPELVTAEAERGQILGLFLAKYGHEQFARWYDRPARVLRVTIDGAPAGTSLGSSAYYHWLEAEFDNIADDYDRHITGNRMNLLLRDRSLATLRERFAGSHRLLEIGCGSGMETIPLLELGHEILAVDISGRMLDVVRRKAKERGISERLTTRELPARDLGRVLELDRSGSFDGAYSTYGALNCEPDLSGLSRSLGRLLRPRAPFVAGVYNRWCLFELVGYSLALDGSRAFGRARNPIPVGASRFCVDVYAHSAAGFERLLRPDFVLERLEGVPVLLPPSDLVAYADRFDRHFAQLARWDARLGRHWPFNRLGDHFLMTLVRRSDGGS